MVDEARSNGVVVAVVLVVVFVVVVVVDRCAPNRPARRSDNPGSVTPRLLHASERFGRVHSWTQKAARNQGVISSARADRPYDTPAEKRV